MNMPSILILVLVAAAVLSVIISSIRNRKNGKFPSCGGSCSSCGVDCPHRKE